MPIPEDNPALMAIRDRLRGLVSRLKTKPGDEAGKTWDGMQILDVSDPQSQRDINAPGKPRRVPHRRRDRKNRQADEDSPLEDNRSGGPGVKPGDGPITTKPPAGYYSPADKVFTHRDRRVKVWDFMTTDQEVTKNNLVQTVFDKAASVEQLAAAAGQPNPWFIVSDRRGGPVTGSKVIHYVNGEDKNDAFAKLFSDEARPVWAPDFLRLGFCIVFPWSSLKRLVKTLEAESEGDEAVHEDKKPVSTLTKRKAKEDGEDEPEVEVDENDVPPDTKTGALQPRVGKGQPPQPPTEASVRAAAAPPSEQKPAGVPKGIGKKMEKKEFWLIPVEPEYTPLPMPDPKLQPKDWWERMRTVPQGVSPFLAPGGVRVMGDSKRLSDIAKEFINPGRKGRVQSVPGLGKRFGPSTDEKVGEERTEKDVSQPQNLDMVGNDRTKVNTNQRGDKSSSVTRDSANRQFSAPKITSVFSAQTNPGRLRGMTRDLVMFDDHQDFSEEVMAAKDARRQQQQMPVEVDMLKDVGNTMWQTLGEHEWRNVHMLFKAAKVIEDRTKLAQRESR